VAVVSEIEALLRLALAAGLGAVIGLDRESLDKPAGVRTFSIVALGACLFTLVGALAFGGGDPGSRIASTIVTGVGFLGAGTIIHRRSDVVGLTTAAGLWAAAAVGMAAGVGLYVLAAGGAMLILVILWLIGRLVVGKVSAKTTATGSANPKADDATGQPGS
jgi:putative Mg2+ transporter-C (MgtC) family protein